MYKARFARSQEAYEEAYHTVFNRLDWLEAWLLPHRREKLSENKIYEIRKIKKLSGYEGMLTRQLFVI